MDKISIIVPTYNRKVMLQRLLESFSRLKCHLPLEFIIVDDCSDDGTPALVENWKNTTDFAEVKYHRLASRSGPALARNAGIALSTGNILAFTDSDCITDPSWVVQLYGRLISDPVYAGTGGRVLPVNNDIYSFYYTAFRILEPPGHINTVIGANCMFWKQPVVDVGMFDDYFIHPGGEEIALSMKLWIKGFRFGFEEQAVVYHDYRQSLKDFIKTFYYYGTGERILFENRPKEYFQYMKYPEQIYHYLAFKNFFLFWLIFIMRVIYGIISQRTFTGTLQISYKKRLMLIGLNAIQNFSYHYGRGTFSGAIIKKVRKCGAVTPESISFLERS
jgi:glycosyltransferase involved in cell wall biosynthesis